MSCLVHYLPYYRMSSLTTRVMWPRPRLQSVQLRVYQWLDASPGRTHHTAPCRSRGVFFAPATLLHILTPRDTRHGNESRHGLCLAPAAASAPCRSRAVFLGPGGWCIGPTPGAGLTRDIAGARARAGYLQYNPSYCRVTIIIVCGARHPPALTM